MAQIHHPQLDKTVEVPDKSVPAWEGSGWEKVNETGETGAMTVKQLTAHLETVNDVAVIDAIRQAETADKARATALDAIAAREAAITSS